MRALCLAGAALGLVLVAGCSSKGGGANTAVAGGPGAPAAAPASGPDTVITAADLPHPKAGLWQVSNSVDGAPATLHQNCETGGTDFKPEQLGKGCSKFEFKRTFLGGVVINAECGEGTVKTAMHIVGSGDFTSTYVSDGTVTVTSGDQPPRTIKSHSEAHYIGPCPPGSGNPIHMPADPYGHGRGPG
ncbi:MAG: DUF3617 domain-containing protein [Caulobacterales bacterium]